MLQFGRSSDNDRAYSIIKGRLSLNKDEVAVTYDSVISRIHESCLKLLGGRNVKVRESFSHGLSDDGQIQLSVKFKS